MAAEDPFAPEPPPEELGDHGAALWSSVQAEGLVMRPDELAVLRQACLTADMISRLSDAIEGEPLMVKGSTGQDVLHPLVSELRQERALLANLLGRLDIPEESEEDGSQWNGLTASARARKAAHARWRH